MSGEGVLRENGRAVVVAIDHPLYCWPCPGLEDRRDVISGVVEAGADAVIAAYGTIRDDRKAFGSAAPILKLDLTTVALRSSYAVSEYVIAWTIEDGARLNVKAVLSYVQLGTPFELEALKNAAKLAAACDRIGLEYVCEIMPVQSERFPAATAPDAIAACCRTGAELGAHLIKTTMPTPAASVAEAIRCGVPVILAGGAISDDRTKLLADVGIAVESGAAGVAFGRNVWGTPDPAGMVRELCRVVHGAEGQDERVRRIGELPRWPRRDSDRR